MIAQSPNGFVIDLNSPCEKQWDEMKVLSHNSGFCMACDKVLTNFSEMSDIEILNWFQNHPNEDNPCGFWHHSQLNRPFIATIKSQQGYSFKIRQFLLSTLMFIGVLNSHGQNTIAGDTSIKTEQIDTAKKAVSKLVNFNKNTKYGSIKVNDYWMLKSSAVIKIIETGDSIVSDSFGRFLFDLPDKKQIKKLTFVINYKNITDTIVLKTKYIESHTDFLIKKRTNGAMIRAGGYDKNAFENNHLLFEIWKKGNW